MKCRHCGGALRTIATREVNDGYVTKRTKLCRAGHRYFTFEVDDNLRTTVEKPSRSRELTLQRNAARYIRNQAIRRRRADGWSLKRLATTYGIAETTVCAVLTHDR